MGLIQLQGTIYVFFLLPEDGQQVPQPGEQNVTWEVLPARQRREHSSLRNTLDNIDNVLGDHAGVT